MNLATPADYNPVDTSLKKLFRQAPGALLRLLHIEGAPELVTFEDTAINPPELRADQVLVLAPPQHPEGGVLCFEYQLKPDPEKLWDWDFKRAGLRRQLRMPVVLVVIYLERGDRASFPDHIVDVVAGHRNEIWISSVLLWEHADRIRSGELWELAPALVLCENNPTEATVRTALELIRGAPATEAERANLLAISLRIAGRDFPRPILEAIFREALPMVQGATIIDDWIAEGEARGEARGRTEGEARGTTAEARRIALRLLTARFGELPVRVRDRVAAAEPEWCEELVVRAARAESLAELDW